MDKGFKNLAIKERLHKRIKIRAAYEQLSMAALIERLFDHYERTVKRPCAD
jgi:predicted HicB family RNase H-like nuclease